MSDANRRARWTPGRSTARHAAWALGLFNGLVLAGCSVMAPPASVAAETPPQWYAPLPADAAKDTRAGEAKTVTGRADNLPHQGSLQQLSQWWQQLNDPLLVELIEAAQAVSPTVITARSNLEQARATRTASESALLPKLDAAANLSRSLSGPINRTIITPVTTLGQVGLQTSWELDLFGPNQAGLQASQERLLGNQALWHEARVSVAAEVANQYYSARSCDKQLRVQRADSLSRAETARLTELLMRAGFGSAATSALAQASASEGNSRLTQQAALCEGDLKALVALTAVAEPVLRQRFAHNQSPPQMVITDIPRVPAEVLSQRPDIYNAARTLAAASFEVGSARAQRYPRLHLTGNIFSNTIRARGLTQSFESWSIGPLALTVPLLDGGASQANVEAATARYEEAAGKYRSAVRQAVREVEESLVNLQSSAARQSDRVAAAEGYRRAFAGTEARYQAGLASLVELEDARRTLLAAQVAVLSLERERQSAWIALYRALGGGWSESAAMVPSHP